MCLLVCKWGFSTHLMFIVVNTLSNIDLPVLVVYIRTLIIYIVGENIDLCHVYYVINIIIINGD